MRRYSDFVAYPIRLQIDAGERTEPLNSRQAIWTRPAAEVGDEEYAEFYKHVSHDWNEPLERVAVHIEGNYEARALLFLPSQAPLDLYHADSAQRGVQLYVKRVFIMDDCRELLPEWLRFVRGVVDAEDAALNVSRELLQNDRQVGAIRKRLVKKLLDSLERMLREEREKYARFWAEFGPVLKEALYSLEPERERVLKLLLCETSESAGELTTLAEYVERMGEGQEEIPLPHRRFARDAAALAPTGGLPRPRPGSAAAERPHRRGLASAAAGIRRPPPGPGRPGRAGAERREPERGAGSQAEPASRPAAAAALAAPGGSQAGALLHPAHGLAGLSGRGRGRPSRPGSRRCCARVGRTFP